MWELKNNYRKEEEQPLHPLCETEHVLESGRDENIKERTSKIMVKKNVRKQCRYLERIKGKGKKEEKKFRRKEAVQLKQEEKQKIRLRVAELID